MNSGPLYIGLDLGTSGIRALAIDEEGASVAQVALPLADFGANHRDPNIWQAAADDVLARLVKKIAPSRVAAICVDATSGTLLAIDANGNARGDGKMYNDACSDNMILTRIANHAPPENAARGATSGLAKALEFQQLYSATKIVHQADWISGNLCGIYSSDDNNALKTGYDPLVGKWPDWIAASGMDMQLLPSVLPPGTPVALILPEVALRLNLPLSVKIVAGTTDGCASFLATGAKEPGEGVSVLGSALTLKILSDQPVFDALSGVYSHLLLGKWLVGGSSNTGGNVLLAHFTPDELEGLSRQIDPQAASGLDYYPLLSPGERFPISDSDYPAKMTPVPNDRVIFLQAILEGIASIEALGYQRMTSLGASPLRNVRTIGGGAKNDTWCEIRQRHLGVVFIQSTNQQAAYGAACLARIGA